MQSTIIGNDQVRILFSAKIPFKCREKIKTFPDKQKLREFIIIRFAPKNKTKTSPESTLKQKLDAEEKHFLQKKIIQERNMEMQKGVKTNVMGEIRE